MTPAEQHGSAGNGGSTLERVAALLMRAVGLLNEEIHQRKQESTGSDDDEHTSGTAWSGGQDGSV